LGREYLFDGVVGDQPQNDDLLLLPDTMDSVLSLQVHLRVPIRVEDDHCVCSLQVEAQTTCSGAQKKDIVLTVGLIEEFHAFLAVFRLGGAIEAEMADSLVLEVSLHDIHQMSHLREDQEAVSKATQFGQDAVDEFKLARRADDPLMVADVIVILEEEIGMVAAFA
jgi:hypothetical protein